MSRPRVVMVSASFHPYVGGAEKQALELSAMLRRRGADVVVATRRLPGLAAQENVRDVPVYRLACRGQGLLNAATFMASLAWFLWRRAPAYDIIHAHLAGSPALIAAAVGRLLGKKVFVKLGGGAGIGELAASARTRSGRLKLALLSRLAPRMIAVARELGEEARKYLGSVPLGEAPNGVDTTRYRPAASAEERRQARRELGWPERGLVFLYVGRLSPEKRLPLFVEHWAAAARKSKTSAALAMIGEGSERAPIETAAAYARVSDKVLLRAPMADVERAYRGADVFVLPSVSEGLSNALLEAMASGLAVLASRVGGTPEAVEHGAAGFLFDVDDTAALDGGLAAFFERPELALVMGAAARKAAVERFSLEKIAELWERLYQEPRFSAAISGSISA